MRIALSILGLLLSATLNAGQIQLGRDVQTDRVWTDSTGRQIKGRLQSLTANNDGNLTATVRLVSGHDIEISSLMSCRRDKVFLESLRPTYEPIMSDEEFLVWLPAATAKPPPLNPYPSFRLGWRWSDTRVWTLNDTSTIVGRFESLGQDTVTVRVDDRFAHIPLSFLTRGDRIYAFRAQAQKGPYPQYPTVKYSELTTEDRVRIPSIDQLDYEGQRGGACIPNSIANTVAWWEMMGVLPVEMNKENLQELHQSARNLTGYCRKIFSLSDTHNPELVYALFERAAQGGAAVSITTNTGGGHSMTLVNFDRQTRKITVRSWGESLDGELIAWNGGLEIKPSLRSKEVTAKKLARESLRLQDTVYYIIPDGSGIYF